MQITQTKRTTILLTLPALAIALFMTLPRLMLMVYLNANPGPRLNQITWVDLGSKFIYAFLVACLFLWLNISSASWNAGIKVIKMSRFSHRLVVNILLLILLRWVFKSLGIPEDSALRPGRAAAFLFNISLVLEASFCLLICELYRLFKSNQEQRLRNEMLLKAHAEATFEVLKNQVNPHFLFNSLNTINAIIDKDVTAAKRFVANMSQVYRHILNSAGRPVTTLAEELEFSTAYINMLMERHANALFIVTDVPDAYGLFLLPPVSLQLLIENAFKHNVVSVSSPLTITISAKGDCLVVSNPMKERKQKMVSTGTGLMNLSQRYRYLCSRDIEIIKKDSIFSVGLPLLKLQNDQYVSAL